MIAVKLLLLFLVLGLLPYLTGQLWSGVLPEKLRVRVTGLFFRYIFGLVTMWAVFQLIAVPLILRDAPFRRLVTIWMAVSLILGAAGLIAGIRRKNRADREIRQSFKKLPAQEKTFRTKNEKVFFILAVCAAIGLFAFQAGHHVLLTHIEDDDSRFIVTALEAYEHDQMFRVNPVTGVKETDLSAPLTADDTKDVCSPWMMYVAAVSRVAQLHPAIVAHIVLAVLLTAAAYMAFWMLGTVLFPDSALKQAGFTLFAGLALQYMGGSAFTAGSFALTRIWQGKAVMAAIGIPLLFAEFQMLYRLPREDESRRNRTFVLIAVTGLSSCLLSGMGILLGGIMIAAFGLWYIIAYRMWREIWKAALVLLPSAAYGLLYLKLK